MSYTYVKDHASQELPHMRLASYILLKTPLSKSWTWFWTLKSLEVTVIIKSGCYHLQAHTKETPPCMTETVRFQCWALDNLGLTCLPGSWLEKPVNARRQKNKLLLPKKHWKHSSFFPSCRSPWPICTEPLWSIPPLDSNSTAQSLWLLLVLPLFLLSFLIFSNSYFPGPVTLPTKWHISALACGFCLPGNSG